MLRQSGPLESVIREKLSTKQPEACEWFWSEQVPTVVATFVNYFERDMRFIAATSMYVFTSMLLNSAYRLLDNLKLLI